MRIATRALRSLARMGRYRACPLATAGTLPALTRYQRSPDADPQDFVIAKAPRGPEGAVIHLGPTERVRGGGKRAGLPFDLCALLFLRVIHW